jgi:hypothetical protein
VSLQFPLPELSRHSQIIALMADWKRELSRARVLYREDGKLYPGDSYFCSDGFFPHYYAQKYKILFLARETVDLSGMDYIETLFEAYKANNIGGRTLDQHSFHNRMYYLAYGILNDGKIPYGEAPYASELARNFGTKNGISFAFMELSKYSNDNADANAHRDLELMTAFLKDSHLEKRNFIQEELEILDPDIILAANLWGAGLEPSLLELALGDVRLVDDKTSPSAWWRTITINGRERPLIDLYHFSSRKNTETDFYNPVMKIMKPIVSGLSTTSRQSHEVCCS